MRIFPITAPAFFMRESPTSSIAKPACMKRTRTAAKKTNVVLTAMSVAVTSSWAAARAGTSSSSTATSAGTSRNDLNRIYSPCGEVTAGPRGPECVSG